MVWLRRRRRQAEGLLERTGKVVRAQLHERRQSRNADGFRKMILDKFEYSLALPTGQAAARRHILLPGRTVGSDRIVNRQYAERPSLRGEFRLWSKLALISFDIGMAAAK